MERKVHDKLLDKIVSKSKGRKVGDPFDPETEQGPQVDKDQFDKIMGLIEKGKSQGAECVAGGRRVGNKGFFVEPTVFANVSDEMDIAREEIFGPVLSVIPFDSVEEVVERGNDTYYGLAAAVWTKDVSKAHGIADRLGRHHLGQLLRRLRCGRARLAGSKCRGMAANSDRKVSTTTWSGRL